MASREAAIHRDVAVDPRFPLARRDVGREAVIPEVVLDEPQQRVGDYRVEVVVLALLDVEHLHTTEVIAQWNLGPLLALRDKAVFLGRGRADPTHALGIASDIAQCRSKAAPARFDNDLTVARVETYGAAIAR